MELKYGQPFDLMHWSEQNQDKLTPPVCNTALFPDGDFIINMVGGPNKRTDFHCNPTEEIFYQIKGNAYLNIWDRGQFEQIRLNEGDIFLLPAYLNHSPQRPEAGGLCFLVEKPRALEQKDAFNTYFGAKVDVKIAGNGKGKITIPFHSEEDFNRIIKLIKG